MCLGFTAPPWGLAIIPDGSRVYVADTDSNSVSVVDTSRKKLIGRVAVGDTPIGVAITRDGSRTYVTNSGERTVSVIDTASNTVVDTVRVG
jgi:YVTN family beta-propeller protein